VVPHPRGRIDPRSRPTALFATRIGRRQLPSVSELAERLTASLRPTAYH